MIWICLAFIAAALVLSLPLCAAVLRLSHRWRWLDPIGAEAHKKHERVVPNTGGIAIFWAIALPMVAVLAAAWLIPTARWAHWAPAAAEHLPGLRAMTLPAAGLLAALAVMHILGLIDDRRALGPGVKLGTQLLIALALVLVGQMRVLTYLDHELGVVGMTLSAAVTVAWIIVIVNAFNFLDNMDGLTGGVAAIIAALYLGATLYQQQWFVAGFAALLLGALLGFLAFNVPPARLFMGDAGSLVVGLVLAVISIRTTYFDSAFGSDSTAVSVPGNWYGLLMPLIVMAVPLYDFTSVTLIRLAQGRSPFRGDHSHFSHRLVDLGLSRRRAVGVIWLCTLATGLSGVMLGSLQSWQALLAAGQTCAVLAVLAVLERGAHRRRGDE